MSELSQPTQKLISRYQAWQQSLLRKEGVATVHVDEVAAKVAAFYEKIRGVIDWREEHLLRRAAIERILKRRMLLGQESKNLAQSFVLELIRAGYFPNDRIEEAKIEIVQKTLDKYLLIIQNSAAPAEKLKVRLYGWIFGVAACEVEEILDPLRRERALIDYMQEVMQEKIQVTPQIPELEKNTQISIAIQRALFKLDKPIITYHLLKEKYPQWHDLPPNLLAEVSQNIYSIWNNIEKELKHPLAEKFYRICERYDTPYLILGDILSADPGGANEKISKPEILEGLVRKCYAARLNQVKSRIKRAAIYSTISIFLTKILLALAFEIPLDRFLTGKFSIQATALSVGLPPLLMFFLIATIRSPKKSNLEQVVLATMKIVFPVEKKEIYMLKIPESGGGLFKIIIPLFYLATFILSFGFIWWALDKLEFGIAAKIVFLLFLSLISFAGVKLRERSKELIVEPEKSGFLFFFLDSFSLPFIRIGRWLSGQWTKYNIVIITISAIIDMPLQLFTEFLEQWRNFLKEKKEDIH